MKDGSKVVGPNIFQMSCPLVVKSCENLWVISI